MTGMNPFPSNATTNLEVRPREPATQSTFAPLPPALAPIAAIASRCERLASEGFKGGILAIQGPHGTGKTRLLGEMIAMLSAGRLTPPVLTLYGKCDVDGAAELLRRLLAPITLLDYQQTFLAAQQVLVSRLAPGVADAKLPPAALEAIYTSYLVGRDVVDAELRDHSSAISRNEEFRTAISLFAREPRVSQGIHKWLTGGATSDERLRDIGITGPLISSDDLLSALQLVASLRNQARLPVAVFLDQIERLSDATAGLRVLRALVEWIPSCNGLLVIAGNDAAYDALPGDLVQRLGGIHHLRCLSTDESERLIRVYLEANGELTLENLFAHGVVDAIVETTSGNPRRLLQLCYSSFELAHSRGRPIDRDCVEEAALPAGISIPAVLDHLRSVLGRTGARVHSITTIMAGCDCVIADRNQVDVAQVFIRSAEFYLDEAQAQLEAIRNARQVAISAPLLFIGLGYVSSEVKRIMTSEGVAYVEYDPANFERTVNAVIGDARKTRFVRTIEGAEQVEARLRRVEGALSLLEDKRIAEHTVLDRDIRTIGVEIAGWPTEKLALRNLIAEVRASRAESIADAFVREYAASRRPQRLLVTALGVAGACAVIAGGLLKMPIYAYLGASAIALAAAFVAVMWSRGVTGAIGAAGDPLEEIRLRARKYLRSHWENTQSQNPFARLAAALKARDEWPEHADIVSLIRSESNFIVRRELFRSLSSAPPDTLLACFQALCDDVDARYLVEAVVRAFPSELPPQITARIDAPMSTLFAIYGHTPWRSSDLAYCLAARQTPDHETTLICRAYDGGGERAIESAARHVSLARLEAAETQLSPLLISGLGSLDGLSRARQIEDYYVFFRQLRFMREPNREVAVAETERRLVVSSS